MSDREYLEKAIEVSRNCVPDAGSFSVGAVIVTPQGLEFTGFTHESGEHNHAEEEAINKALCEGINLKGSVIYCSMEPCSTRKSKPVSCTELIIKNGIGKVVYALAEPPVFVECQGTSLLRDAGVEVLHIEELSYQVYEINKHLL